MNQPFHNEPAVAVHNETVLAHPERSLARHHGQSDTREPLEPFAPPRVLAPAGVDRESAQVPGHGQGYRSCRGRYPPAIERGRLAAPLVHVAKTCAPSTN